MWLYKGPVVVVLYPPPLPIIVFAADVHARLCYGMYFTLLHHLSAVHCPVDCYLGPIECRKDKYNQNEKDGHPVTARSSKGAQ